MNLSYYFDYGATAPLMEEALDAMMPLFSKEFGNPSSLHRFGLKAKESLEHSRAVIAESLGARPREIVFTGSGTEANNIAIFGSARKLKKEGKGNHLITSVIEHASVLKSFRRLEKEGFHITYIPVDEYGRIHLENVKRAVRTDTVFASIMHANNVIGTVQPIAEIGAFLKEKGILLHTDAVQSYGKIPVNAAQLNAGLISTGAHKIGGPKGVGALYIRNRVRLEPIAFGGGHERGIRPATHNVPGIAGFAKAAEIAIKKRDEEAKRLTRLRDFFIMELKERCSGVKVNGHHEHTLPNLINISVENIEGQGLMLELDRQGFATSSGSACSSADQQEPSYVLLAANPSRQHALESLRITMGAATTRESVNALLDALARAVERWQSVLILNMGKNL